MRTAVPPSPLRRSPASRLPVLLRAALGVLLVLCAGAAAVPGGDAAVAAAGTARAAFPSERDWTWPLSGIREVNAPFRAPAHDYGPGHRGIDIVASGSREIVAPASGVVAFRGTVVDRPLLTIDHGDGLVTTLEPVLSELPAGTPVAEGELLGVVDAGGHAPSGTLHVGVRWHGAYVNPLLLFGAVPRAILLPCCSPP